jgi:hypothetical protein
VPVRNFASQTISSVRALTDHLARHEGAWAYRGQSHRRPLVSSLEQLLSGWKIDPAYGPRAEQHMIREFRRRYRYDNQDLVKSDVLYCLSVMQHYDLPTRLLECSYSPYVAAKFAIESGRGHGTIWCFNTKWCEEAASAIAGTQRVQSRKAVATRDDRSFVPLYMGGRKRKFVLPERPLELHERLIAQQGVYLCPGDVGVSLVRNIMAMRGWEKDANVVKLRLRFGRTELRKLEQRLDRMQVNSAELFPGLDGIVRSLKERLLRDRRRRRAGQRRRRK